MDHMNIRKEQIKRKIKENCYIATQTILIRDRITKLRQVAALQKRFAYLSYRTEKLLFVFVGNQPLARTLYLC